MTIVAPLLGFAVVVTLAYLSKCAYLYLFAMNANEAKNAPRKARTEYRIGMATFIGGAVVTFIVICWVVGRALMEVL